jgi:hypothetical protein
MNFSDLLSLIFFPVAIAAIAFVYYLRRFPPVYIPDYARGVRFVKGSFRDVVGPGSYQNFAKRVQIEVIDMRPVPVIVDRIFYRDALQNDSVVSIGAEVLVDDPYLAATSLKNRVGDSLPIVRDTLRSTMAGGIADLSPEYRVKAADDIASAVNAELNRMGMKISNVEVTELSSRRTFGRATAGLN